MDDARQKTVAQKKAAGLGAFPAAFATAGTLGLHIVAGTLVGAVIGYLLDDWLGTSPWLLLLFLVIGTGAGYKNMIEDLRKLDQADHTPGAMSQVRPQAKK